MLDAPRKYTLLLLIVWIAAGLVSLLWNLYDDRREHRELALQSARTFLTQIQNLRTWNTSHGGIYVPLTDRVLPHPYLDDPQRDLETIEGIHLTKINAAYMIRQLSEIALKQNKVRYHITSLNPIRPENKPSAWERQWLDGFNQKPEEASGYEVDGNRSVFRYMAPLTVTRECLPCHEHQGYKLNDIRGGISITIPMEQLCINWIMIGSHVMAMMTGSIMLLFFGSRLSVSRKQLLASNTNLRQQVQERRKAQKNLSAAKEFLEKRVLDRTRELSEVNRELNRKIHQRARMKEALIMIYNEFYQLFNSAPDGMLVIDHQFHILRVNKAFTKLCGLEENDIIGSKCHTVFKGDSCDSKNCPLTQILDGERRLEIETVKTLKDGTKIPCITTATSFLDPDGTEIGAVMVFKDISERKMAEQVLTESAAQLRRSNQALQNFTHIISHDLQAPLMLIRAFSRRLQKKIGNTINDQSQQYIQQIEGSAGRMQDLIKGLLNYSRISRETKPFTLVNLNEILGQVCDDLTIPIEQTDAHITVDDIPPIEADPLGMRQLFQNLIGNSLRYMRENEPLRISVTCIMIQNPEAGVEYVQLCVQDNGAGFPPENRKKIFNLFERLDADRTSQGYGIGLAICKKNVENHNGTITADSRLGQGTNFTITLPVHQEKGH